MKKFFKDGFDTILKLMVSQLGMTMFGIMVTMATRIVPGFVDQKRNTLSLIASLFAIVFYMFLLYIHIWDKGARDRLMVDGKRAEYIPLKGLYLSLVANSINIILALIMCCTYYFCDFVNAPNALICQIFASANDFARILQGMYVGLILYISPNATQLSPFIFLAIILPALIVCALGYHMGFSNRKLFGTNKTK